MRMSFSGWLAACLLLPGGAAAPPWDTHNGPGFSVETPPGWSAFPDAKKGWIHLMGTAGEDVVIWPVFLPGGPANLDLKTAQTIHQRLAAACPYNAEWETAQPVGTNAVRARGKSGEMVAVSAFAWKPSPRGVVGYFYLAGARETDFSKKTADLALILKSFRLAGIAGAATGGQEYVPFADPLEGAFIAEVPAGWQASGGMVRSGPNDPHLVLGVTSPDGQTKVSLGDPQMSTYFQEPVGIFPEGAMNGSVMVLRYLTGAYFCQFYVSRKAPMFCSDLRITDMRDNPEMIQYALARDPALANIQFAIGSVTFQCLEQGQPRAGFCQAVTMGGGTGLWRLHSMRSYLTPPDRAEQAKAIMNHMSESIQFNPQWGANEVRQAGIRSGIISGTNTWIADRMAEGQARRDAVRDRIAQMQSDATLGIVRLADPVTGRQTTVDSGSNYYWVDPGGRIVGTQVDTVPGVEFRKLLEMPPR